MAIRFISSAWQKSLAVFTQDHRVYIDFRQQLYPDMGAGAPTFTLITSADNQPGSHNFTGGYGSYLLNMPSKMTLDFYFKPTFSYTGGTNQYLWSWYMDATHNLSFYFDVTAHEYTLTWQDGGTARTMVSTAYASDLAFQVWTRATFSLDLTTGTNAGSAFYLQGASVSTTWSGASDVAARFLPVLTIRGQNGTAGAYTINYARMFSGITSTSTEVTANFSAKLDEEIVWHFNGHSCGHTRCNVSKRVRNVSFTKTIESAAGNANPNSASLVLMSTVGQFADDQYAAFNAAAEIYNGTSSQKYMQTHCTVEIETWYLGVFELEFVGHVDDSLFTRSTTLNDISLVTITAMDTVEWLKRALASSSVAYENYDLSKPSDYTTSLLHTIVRLNTNKKWVNYLANSSFENATAANSWGISGGGATITRVAGGLIGSWQGDMLCTTQGTVTQTITFTGAKLLDSGQNWDVSCYVKTATAGSFTLALNEQGSAGTAITTNVTTVAISASVNWQKIEKAVTISTNTTSRLVVQGVGTAMTVSMDAFMLLQNKTAINWVFGTTNDGSTALSSADNMQSSGYDTVGFDTDDAPITHPWAVVQQNNGLWPNLNDIYDATAAYYIGMDSCGTFKYRTPFKAGYSDPSSTLTVSAVQQVDSIMDAAQANHIVVNGISILKDTTVSLVWDAKNSNSFAITGTSMYEAVNAGSNWPNQTTYPEYWAVYSDNA